MRAARDTIQHLFRFLIVGLISTIINYLFFIFFLKEWEWQYQIASICGFIIGVSIGYPLNKLWTYKVSHKTESSAVFYKYGCVYLASLTVNFYVLGFLVKKFSFDPRVANGAAIIVTTIINFIGTKFWAFRAPSRNDLTIDTTLNKGLGSLNKPGTNIG
jgi:putative flippase GtrA